MSSAHVSEDAAELALGSVPALVAYRVRSGELDEETGTRKHWWIYFTDKERAEWFAALKSSKVEPLYVIHASSEGDDE